MVSQPDQHFYSNSLAIRGATSLVGVNSSGGHGHGHSHSHSGPSPPSAASVAGGGSHRDGHTSSTRSRRYNRSHIGGSSSSSPYAQLNEFPVFTNTGDVEIVVRVRSGHENRYLLHRDTLARCSGFFEASTSKEWSRAQVIGRSEELPSAGDSRALTSGGEVARVGAGGSSRSGSESGREAQTTSSVPSNGQVRQRWRYELDMGEGDHDKPILVQKEESSSSRTATTAADAPQSIFGGGPTNVNNSYSYRGAGGSNGSKAAPTHSNPSFFRSVANLALSHSSSRHASHHGGYGGYNTSSPLLPPPTPDEVDLLRDYDNLFRIMYNYPPVLDGVNIADAYVQCKSLLAVADEYDALAFVGPRVDHHLLQFQSRLWRQIAKYPISYLRLGYMARSRVIFQEALVHVVGQWPAGERSLRAAMPDSVLDLIEDKVDELAEAVSRVEARLFRLHLTTRGGERVAPSTAYVDWLAVSLFRQWLADNTTPPMGGDPKVMIPERRGAGATGDRYGHHHRSQHHHRGGGSSRHDRASSSSSSSSGSGRHHQETALTLHVRNALVPALSPPLSSLGRTYRILGLAPAPSYLGHEECKRFLKLSPDLYTRDNLRRFEKRIDELKALAREIVRPLMGSGLELDVAGGKSSSGHGSSGGGNGGGNGPHDSITYFTCTYLSDRDLPWLVDI